jgi:hypothetical protein
MPCTRLPALQCWSRREIGRCVKVFVFDRDAVPECRVLLASLDRDLTYSTVAFAVVEQVDAHHPNDSMHALW